MKKKQRKFDQNRIVKDYKYSKIKFSWFWRIASVKDGDAEEYLDLDEMEKSPQKLNELLDSPLVFERRKSLKLVE